MPLPPHPAAVPDPDKIWEGPWEMDVAAVAALRAEGDREAATVAGPPHPVHDVRDAVVDGVPCRVYVDEDPVATVVYVHGGGWVFGSLETVDGVCRRLAAVGRLAVVSVDYRLAPEVTWPAPLDDVDAVVAAVQRGEVDGAPASPVAVAGDSAGGHLASLAARRADADGRPVGHQALVYPVIDGVGIREGDPTEGMAMGLSRGGMDAFWRAILPDDARRDTPDVSPLHGDLARTPPTTLVLAAHDVLHDEGERYAAALVDAGVDVVVTTFPRMAHGFFRRLAVFPDAVTATDLLATSLHHALT